MRLSVLLLILIFFFTCGYKAVAGDANDLKAQYAWFQVHSECDFTIASGKRSIKLNKAVGGSKKSFHLEGLAFDLVPTKNCSKSYTELYSIAKVYFTGVILYKDHLHVDVGSRIYHKIKE